MKEIMIDINKPLKAKIYGFDESYYEPDGVDDVGEYIIVDVHGIMLPHLPYTKYTELMTNAGRSDHFILLPQGSDIS